MTDGSSGGSGHPNTSGGVSGSGNVQRRISYASVVSGIPTQNHSSSARAGTYAHMATTNPQISYPPVENNARHGRQSQEQDSGSMRHKDQLQQLPPHSRKYAAVLGNNPKQNDNSFFVPSYLRDSSYVARLQALHTQRVREKDSRPGPQHGVSSSTSNSNIANIHRIAPSHRGMTYEVIESNPPKDEDQILPLPSKWNEQDKYPGLDVFNEGLDVRYNGTSSKSEVEAASVRADYPMAPACGIYYYEVAIKSKSKECAVAVGFSTAKASLERLPGWEPESWAYHGDDGKTFSGEHSGQPYHSTFAAGDVIGCGINFNTGQAFFTKNGQDLGIAFRELKNTKPFPCIGIKKYSSAVVSVNFGQRPFIFNIDEKFAQEQIAVDGQIRKTKTNKLHPKLDENMLIQELVSQFLVHGGYVETSKAFEEDIKKERRSLTHVTSSSIDTASEVDATNATMRQQIRRAILAGDIDLAFHIVNDHYPHVLEQSPDIVFHMKCRKWIELISRATDLRSHQDSVTERQRSRKTSSGIAKSSVAPPTLGHAFDQHMELDVEQQTSTNGAGKRPADSGESNADLDMAYNLLLSQAMEYGQILQREYPSEKNTEHKDHLQHIFSLIAYPEPRQSMHGHLLDTNGRVKVAEELNSAILVSLGRPPTAALENTYKQTEALLNILGAEGSSASFVNLRARFDEGR